MPARDVGAPLCTAAVRKADAGTMENLATRLMVGPGQPAPRFGLTASRKGEGVTTLAVNLALTLCERLGRRVALVDLNLADPSLGKIFDIDDRPGVAEVLTGAVAPARAVVPVPAVERLVVMPAGRMRPAPAAAADLPRLAMLRELLQQQFDIVLYDCPPVQGGTIAVASTIGVLLVVVEAERTPRAMVGCALRDLEVANARVAGIILNRHRRYGPDWLHRLT